MYLFYVTGGAIASHNVVIFCIIIEFGKKHKKTAVDRCQPNFTL